MPKHRVPHTRNGGMHHVVTQQHFSEKLNRLVGLPHCPRLVDVRLEEDFSADPVLIPGSVRRSWQAVESWADEVADQAVMIVIAD